MTQTKPKFELKLGMATREAFGKALVAASRGLVAARDAAGLAAQGPREGRVAWAQVHAHVDEIRALRVQVGGAVGGLTGALIGMGIPEYEAKRYEGRVKDGGILLSVHSDDSTWTKKAKEILERTGAQDVSSTGEATADKDDKARVREVA